MDRTLSVLAHAWLHVASLPSLLPTRGVDRSWRRKKRCRKGVCGKPGEGPGMSGEGQQHKLVLGRVGAWGYVAFL